MRGKPSEKPENRRNSAFLLRMVKRAGQAGGQSDRLLGRQRRRYGGYGARHRVWLGGWDRCRACLSTGRRAFYRIGHTNATAAPTMPDRSPHPVETLCVNG